MDSENEESFVEKTLKKLKGGKPEIVKRGMHVCPWCSGKPKDGARQSLVQHAGMLMVDGKTHKERGNHRALAQFLCPDGVPNFFKRSTKKARRFE